MKTTTSLLLATAALLASCKEKPAAPPASASSPADHAAVQAVLTAAPAGDVKSIVAARAAAKPGDEVTLTGRIMGNASPFVAGRAAFILADPAVLAACNDKPGDECDTPWDSCCNTPEEKKKGTATIQIVGADGRVLKESLEGTGGLAKLATVTVTGKVAPGSTADLLMVNATAIKASN